MSNTSLFAISQPSELSIKGNFYLPPFSYVKDSTHLVKMMEYWKIEEGDILTSFNVISLCMKIPIDEAIKVIKDMVNNDEKAKLVEICLKSTLFNFRGEIYEQKEGVAMGSPLSRIVSNIFMEKLEKDAIDSFPLKPKWWLGFVDDVYSNWPYGEEALKDFVDHLNNQYDSIKFTTEREEKACLPFLDVLTMRKQDGSLRHQVYRKQTHTDQYLHIDSHHHPS